MRVMRILADTTNRIAEGEVLQLMHLNNPDTDEAAYFGVIERKTAVLFSAAARLGAILARLPEADEQAMAEFGMNLGMAFQIADDWLDYVGDADALGKNLGDDLAEGKATLPLIRTLASAAPETAARMRDAVAHGSLAELPEITRAIQQSGALEYCRERAHGFAERARAALGVLPDSPWRAALGVLSDYSVSRDR